MADALRRGKHPEGPIRPRTHGSKDEFRDFLRFGTVTGRRSALAWQRQCGGARRASGPPKPLSTERAAINRGSHFFVRTPLHPVATTHGHNSDSVQPYIPNSNEPRGSPSATERLSTAVRDALYEATKTAQSLKRATVEPEDLLAALARLAPTDFVRAFGRAERWEDLQAALAVGSLGADETVVIGQATLELLENAGRSTGGEIAVRDVLEELARRGGDPPQVEPVAAQSSVGRSRSPRLASRADSVLVVIDLQDSFLRPIRNRERVIERSAFLIEIANLLQIPVIATEQYAERMGGTTARIADLLKSGPEPVDKLCFSSCGSDAFLSLLSETRRPSVIIVGIETHICVNQTAHDLLSRGHRVFICWDAVASRLSEADDMRALDRMKQAGAIVCHSESIAYEWLERAGTEEFKAALDVVKRYSVGGK